MYSSVVVRFEQQSIIASSVNLINININFREKRG